ncbi:hydroxyacid dehydrogenase [Komagataeibacter diospyri]|uniref:D-3-phosphoglycerate dehydrogenase n=1 Tax=Komagataeibacter diospyri TaxID=1932662 RepID=A0A4P5NXH0_9PROT|nr:hydroxyacid dehydrogenase [Komagataeibacter diospyri]GCE85024.1 D-3-phosphoglycerate dehydrogenase [Komagataeibacter diospyri]
MPHILVAGRLHSAGLALLDRTPGVTYDYVEEISEESYAPFMADVDGLILRTQPLSAATVERASRLRVVSRHGVGYDGIDLPALDRRDITLCIVGDVNSVSVAEHAMTLILACAKYLVRADQAVRHGQWDWRNRLMAGEVGGRRLLILGYGRTGRHLATMAAGFGMEIRAYDPYLSTRGKWPAGPVREVADLHDGLEWADIISVNVPKGDRPLVGEAELRRVRSGAIIVNTARGGIVDEAALAAAILNGRIAAAGLDVFDPEPPSVHNPLIGLDQVILTPHIAGLTAQAAERMAIHCVRNVLDFFAGTLDPTLIVNREFVK